MKLELIKQNKKYFIRSWDGKKEEIVRDLNEDEIAYTNKCFAIFDRRVDAYKEFRSNFDEDVIKSVNI